MALEVGLDVILVDGKRFVVARQVYKTAVLLVGQATAICMLSTDEPLKQAVAGSSEVKGRVFAPPTSSGERWKLSIEKA